MGVWLLWHVCGALVLVSLLKKARRAARRVLGVWEKVPGPGRGSGGVWRGLGAVWGVRLVWHVPQP